MKNRRAPHDKHHEGQTKWHDRPKNFQAQVAAEWARGCSSSDRRRYLTAKAMIKMRINAGEKHAYAKEKNKAGRRAAAIVEACSGNRGKPSVDMTLRRPPARPPPGIARAAASRSRSRLTSKTVRPPARRIMLAMRRPYLPVTGS